MEYDFVILDLYIDFRQQVQQTKVYTLIYKPKWKLYLFIEILRGAEHIF